MIAIIFNSITLSNVAHNELDLRLLRYLKTANFNMVRDRARLKKVKHLNVIFFLSFTVYHFFFCSF